GAKGDGESKDDKPAGDKKDEKATDDAWSQPEVKELPETDKAAAEALGKAWDSTYSPRGRGLEKFASKGSNSLSLDLSQMGMPNIDSTDEIRVAWETGKDVDIRILQSEAADSGPMAGVTRMAS